MPIFVENPDMGRIRLTKNEKKVLRLIADGLTTCPNYAEIENAYAVCVLEYFGLVCAAYDEGGDIVDVRMTAKGFAYMYSNPRLLNPVNWQRVTAIAVCVTIAAVVALFVSCGIID